MSPEISLFPKKISKIRQKQRLKKLAIRVLFLGLLALAGLMIILSVISLTVARGNKQVDEKIKTTKGKIASLSEVESKQVYLSSKLSSFKSLLKTHEAHQAVTETVFSVIPDGTTLRGFQVNEEGVISLSGSVPDFLTLEELLKRVKGGPDSRLPIVEAKVNRVAFGKAGVISFDIDLVLEVKGG